MEGQHGGIKMATAKGCNSEHWDSAVQHVKNKSNTASFSTHQKYLKQ
jgi:hypothetical protein